MTIASHEKYVQMHGDTGLDTATKEGIEGMKKLLQQLEKEYF
jgi:hypothetical protein